MSFRPKITSAQHDAIRNADKAISNNALARQYGVTRGAIEYHRYPGRKARDVERHRIWHNYKRFIQSGLKIDKKKLGRPKKIKLSPYDKMIHEAIGQGVGIDELERKIDENLSSLTSEKRALESRIRECLAAQGALYRYLNPTPQIISSPDLVVRGELGEYLTSHEMKTLMGEAGLSAVKLAANLSHRYSVRAIRAYMTAQVKVPKPIADYLKGCPKYQGEKV